MHAAQVGNICSRGQCSDLNTIVVHGESAAHRYQCGHTVSSRSFQWRNSYQVEKNDIKCDN